MKTFIARIAAAVLVSWALPPAAHAAFILGDAVFELEYFGSGEEGDSYDPPLPGSGSFRVRSLHYDPDAVNEDPFPPAEFHVLDFSFSFNGQSWDESDVQVCDCSFEPDGLPLSINFQFDDGVVSWILSWNFQDHNFGFQFQDPTLDLGGTSADGEVGGMIVDDFRVLPEPRSLALFALGLAAVTLTRLRRATGAPSRSTRA
jgi:hypothetical protein